MKISRVVSKPHSLRFLNSEQEAIETHLSKSGETFTNYLRRLVRNDLGLPIHSMRPTFPTNWTPRNTFADGSQRFTMNTRIPIWRYRVAEIFDCLSVRFEIWASWIRRDRRH